MLGSVFLYAGLIACGLGIVLAVTGLTWPAKSTHVVSLENRLDEFAPVYEFHEVHSILIQAPRDQIYQAIKQVTAKEIRFFRTLTWIRRFGKSTGESILNPTANAPILDVAARSGFLVLADDPGREMVLGLIVKAPGGARRLQDAAQFQTLEAEGVAKAVLNFLIEDAGPGIFRLTTETRVHATDEKTRRNFAAYWRVIYPGSALIRRSWLQAIQLRAWHHNLPAL